MSSSYKFTFQIDLELGLQTDSVAVIDYLLRQTDALPKTLPDHSFFSHGLPSRRFGLTYASFPSQAYSSLRWRERNTNGDIIRHAIDLLFPSEKLEGIYEECLPFASWLASLSISNGFVGAFHQTDLADFNPTLLFLRDQDLYMGNTSEAHSFKTGDKMSSKSGSG